MIAQIRTPEQVARDVMDTHAFGMNPKNMRDARALIEAAIRIDRRDRAELKTPVLGLTEREIGLIEATMQEVVEDVGDLTHEMQRLFTKLRKARTEYIEKRIAQEVREQIK